MTATLFLVVDAIPLGLAAKAFDEGLLPGFSAPAPMISVFPSLTNVAVPALLGGVLEVRPPGYEARHYHPPSGEIRGGFSDPSSESGMHMYRGHPSGTLEHFAVYALRRRLAWQQIRWIGYRFRRDGGAWLGYLGATDGVGHFGGETALWEAFADICEQVRAMVRRFEEQHGETPRVVLCSDHGLAFGRLDHLDAAEVEERLRLVGFHPGKPAGTGFVLCPMGDVSGGAAWCAPGAAPELAQALVELPGVDVAACRTPTGARVFRVDAGGLAVANVKVRDGRYRYEPVTGDPLGVLGCGVADLEAEGATPADLLARTWDHPYPDALVRVVEGLTDLVQHPATVLFSMADGWTYGPRLTHLAAATMGGQVGTHGGLSRAQSTGFVTAFGAGDAVDVLRARRVFRARDVFRPFAPEIRATYGDHAAGP